MQIENDASVGVVGAGLAGCEAAWQLAVRGVPVTLYEMRPQVTTPAHQTAYPAELVCSNSLKSMDLSNAHGLLKAEMELAGSLIVKSAKSSSLPAGQALAVDRELFSKEIDQRLQSCPKITRQNIEIKDILSLKKEHTYIILASGPLTSDELSNSLFRLLDDDGLFFYDAIAPVVFTESIDMNVAFKASRYGKGDSDYINCPMNELEYYQLIDGLVSSKKVPFNEFEQAKHFEGCLPIEVMAARGPSTLSFGPMKPVGLIDPRTGRQPYAVLQLRQENEAGTLFNLVGCQTRMVWSEQERVFKQIPGLENCEFARMGSMHRNTYVNAPKHLKPNLELKKQKNIYLSGQITGVEGYVESASMGMWVAISIYAEMTNINLPQPDSQSIIGALVNYLMTASPDRFQPMNSNFGLITPYAGKKKLKKKDKRLYLSELALAKWKEQLLQVGWTNTSDI